MFDSCTHVIQTDFLEQCVFNCVCVCESGVGLSGSGVNSLRQNSVIYNAASDRLRTFLLPFAKTLPRRSARASRRALLATSRGTEIVYLHYVGSLAVLG